MVLILHDSNFDVHDSRTRGKGRYQGEFYPLIEVCPAMKKDREKTNTATKRSAYPFGVSCGLNLIGNAGIVTSVFFGTGLMLYLLRFASAL